MAAWQRDQRNAAHNPCDPFFHDRQIRPEQNALPHVNNIPKTNAQYQRSMLKMYSFEIGGVREPL